ncbi:MAG TPA: STAS domain-containing protein [Polyangiaceae bacterium]|jgi:anti-sigma B factor antagonist|nr:STAS domain-containing protein [Polyangiaceae bacterium]
MNYSRIDEGTNTTLRIRGELDALSAPELRPIIDELVDGEQTGISVELSGLRMIDSSGVGALVSLYKRVRARGGEVQFSGVTAQPLVIFKLLRLDTVFGLGAETSQAETEAEAQKLPISVRVEN